MYQELIKKYLETLKHFDVRDVQAEDQKNSQRSNEHIIYGGSLNDSQIQDVDVTSEQTNRLNKIGMRGTGRTEFNSQEDNNVVYGGKIYWESLEKYHKVKWRGYITAITLLLWVILTIVGLTVYVNTGNYFLLIFSPGSMMGIALYLVLFKLLRYYFGSSKGGKGV